MNYTRSRVSGRRLLLVMTTILLLLAASAVAGKRVDNLTFDEDAAGITVISIETINGDIELVGNNSNSIHIEAKRTIRGDNDKIIAEYAEEFKPKIKRSGKTVHIETVRPKNNRKYSDRIDQTSISYVITLPSSLGISAEAINGGLLVDEVYGELSLETVNGDIDLDATSEVSEGISAKSVNGELSIDIHSLMADGSFETVNGKVKVTVREELGGGIEAESVNGTVTIRLPENASFSIDAEVGMNGSIRSDWGKGDDDRMFGESLTIDVNGGGEEIQVETFNGSIKIMKANS